MSQAASVEQNKAVVRRLYEEAFNEKQLQILDQILAADIVDHGALPGQGAGREGYKQAAARLFAAFPDVRYTLDKMVAEIDMVAVHWSATGTHLGALNGMPATGKSASITGTFMYRPADGRIAEEWSNWDQLGLLQQLGALPAPEPVGT